jgi:predicted secreted Zn-dependent protease
MLMRLVLALLLAAVVVGPAAAQQAKPVQSNKPAQANPPSQPAPVSQSKKESSPEEIMRQRVILRERFNKGWDIQPESPQDRERRCKREARKQYSAFHPLKRRKFAKECVARAKP